MHITRKEYDGYGALVATTRPTKTPTVMLAAHLDVVPAPDSLFELREVGGKLYGRGTYDMKFAIAGYMALVDQLQEDLATYDFGIMITTDEETFDQGVELLLKDGFLPKAAVLLDGGRDWLLEAAAKGAWCIKVSAQGKTAHGSRPWEGESASFKLHELLTDIRKLFPKPTHDSNTLNISGIHAGVPGKVLNQIPDLAWATLDIRVTNEDAYTRLRTSITTLCNQYEATLETLVFFPPLKHDTQDPYLAAFAASIEKVTGVTGSGVTSLAVSDAIRFHQYGIPCAITYPPGGGHHGDDEWVDKKALTQIVPILYDYLNRVAISKGAAPTVTMAAGSSVQEKAYLS